MKQTYRRCYVCKVKFKIDPQRLSKVVCSPECAEDEKGIRAGEIRRKRLKSEERKKDRERLDKISHGLSWHKKNVQKLCNQYVRMRDKDLSCISCGKPASNTPNDWDAGHYRSVGAAPHLRFNVLNIHKQCKHCNQYLAGNIVMYRLGLIDRIGLAEVEKIEADQEPRHYKIHDLELLAEEFKRMIKELEK